MSFRLLFTQEALCNLEGLAKNRDKKKQLKAVQKSLGYLEMNPKHPGLSTHEYTSLSRQFGTKVFEAYAESRTPQAYRIFWHYGSQKNEMTLPLRLIHRMASSISYTFIAHRSLDLVVLLKLSLYR